MKSLRKRILSALPAPVRRVIRRTERTRALRRALDAMMAAPDGQVEPGVLDAMVRAWGNTDYCAEQEYLAAVVARAWDCGGPILECGSGLSTLVLGRIAAKTGARVVTLEHEPQWADRVDAELRRLRIAGASVVRTPLRDHGGCAWYDTGAVSADGRFALVVCDGPPASTRGGRYGLAPCMRDRLAPGCIILLDDAGRPDEQAVLARWSAEMGGAFEMHGTRKPYAEMRLPG